MGYHRAGFEVIGVDIRRQPNYPFEFHQADAMTWPLEGFDAIHASPPCQAYSRASLLAAHQGNARSTVDLVAPTRERMPATVPWVIENVEGAPVPGLMLCGSVFGLRVRRHRLFETSVWIGGPGACQHAAQGKPVGLYGRMNDTVQGASASGRWVRGGTTAATLEEAQAAIGIDWMPRWSELKEAIPPAYTEWIGRQLLVAARQAVAL